MNDYVIYLGDKIKTVGLWKREDGKEYPIYGNTRGASEWYSLDVGVYENTGVVELSDVFIEWLAHYHRVENGLLESDSDSMFLAEHVEEDAPDENPRWFEVEILNAMGNPGYTPEQGELMEWAYNEVQE